MVHYSCVDEAIKIANRSTASETVRPLLVYGYVIDPPSGDQQTAETDDGPVNNRRHRTYRLEMTYGVSSGKWYYECEILTPGSIKIGWSLVEAAADNEIGGDSSSWAYDGHNEDKIHGGVVETYGKYWQPGDVVGVFLDLTDRTISKLEKQRFNIFVLTSAKARKPAPNYS